MYEQTPATAVIKWGSSNGTNHAEQIHTFIEGGYQVIAVQSGAIAAGREVIAEVGRSSEALPLPSVATVGSALVFTHLQNQLLEKGIVAGQVLVTHNDLSVAERKGLIGNLTGRLLGSARRSNKLKQTLEDNLKHDIVSVINESDALSDIEIAAMTYGGDNDGLARHAAQLMQARHLLLLTGGDGIKGLMDAEGDLVRRVAPEDRNHALDLAEETSIVASGAGRGGIVSKVKEASRAAESGIHAYIANSDADPIDVIRGDTGTHFVPGSTLNTWKPLMHRIIRGVRLQ